jgi:GNAT superfamily N-acetyltransferase
MTNHLLRRPTSDPEWKAYHDIRRVTLFEASGRFGVYDATHPDERKPDNHPLVLFVDDEPIGTIRVDKRPDLRAVLRLVAIHRGSQGCGHGQALLKLAEDFARDIGCAEAVVNAAPEAIGFYRKAGYVDLAWDPAEGGLGHQMAKSL